MVTRASGLALAVATLMLPLIAVGYVSGTGFLGGPVGAPLTGTLWPSSSASTTLVALGGGLIVVVLLAVVVFIASRILSSDIGLELFVLGVDERTAAALGVRTPRRKLELFVLGCVFAALGGAVYAGTQQFVPETVVDPTTELALLIMLFIGGRRSVIGAVIGALVIQYLQGASNWVSVNILVVEGVLLTVVLLVDPEGLAGIVADRDRVAAREVRAGRRGGELAPAEHGRRGRRPAGPAADGRRRGHAAGSAGRDRRPVAVQRARGRRPAASRPADATLLEVRGVFKEYGGLSVLHDVTLALPERGLFGLCGPNGAGKSTLLNVIGGSVAPSSGEVILSGTDITRRPPHERFYQGISRTFQAVHLIKGRTVLDNVAVACLASHTASIVTRIGRSRLDAARAKAARDPGRPGHGAPRRPRGLQPHAGDPADGRAGPGARPQPPAAAARRAGLRAVGGAAPAARRAARHARRRAPACCSSSTTWPWSPRSASGSSCCPAATSSSTAGPPTSVPRPSSTRCSSAAERTSHR